MTRRAKRDHVKRHLRALSEAKGAGGVDLDGTATCDALRIKIEQLLDDHEAMIVVRPTDPRLVGRGEDGGPMVHFPVGAWGVALVPEPVPGGTDEATVEP